MNEKSAAREASEQDDSTEEGSALSALDDVSSRIVIVRDLRVMLDTELAMLYGVTTGALVQAVKRNEERFPADFMFQL